ncbi:dethiobiotin synthase [Coprobacter secundus]|uniref:dethiobiotin synthase n=1 Tax=Coprobacter secundus TaxID=1501392 RepID=UPI00352212D0
MNGIYFVTGIDTNIGKSIATGWLAKQLFDCDRSVITQKLVQTGNNGYSEDIELHRKIMGIDFTEVDKKGLTASVIFSYPASPHLASRIDNQNLDLEIISKATEKLASQYDIVLLEGAGGPMVPLTTDLLTIDYIAQRAYPVILVTSGRLGSINHTLLCFEALLQRGMELYKVIYNMYPSTDKIIEDDTLQIIKLYMNKYFPSATLVEMPKIDF